MTTTIVILEADNPHHAAELRRALDSDRVREALAEELVLAPVCVRVARERWPEPGDLTMHDPDERDPTFG